MLVSGLFPEEPASIAPLIFERTGDDNFLSDTALPKAPYLIAIASELAPRLAPVSLLVERSIVDAARFAGMEAEMECLRISEAAARAAAETEREAARVAVEAARMSAEQAEADARAALVEANTELDQLSGSALHFFRQYLPRLWRNWVN